MYKKLYHNNSSVTDSTKYTNNMQNKQKYRILHTKSKLHYHKSKIINKKIHIKKQILMTFYSRISINPLKNSHLKYLHLKYLHLKYLISNTSISNTLISNTPISNTSISNTYLKLYISKYRKL